MIPVTPEAREALETTSDEGLLRTFAALTHRIHEAHDAPLTAARTRGDYEPDLRAQRDAVQAEVLRRMGSNR